MIRFSYNNCLIGNYKSVPYYVWDNEKYKWFIESFAKDCEKKNVPINKMCFSLEYCIFSYQGLHDFVKYNFKCENVVRKIFNDVDRFLQKKNIQGFLNCYDTEVYHFTSYTKA